VPLVLSMEVTLVRRFSGENVTLERRDACRTSRCEGGRSFACGLARKPRWVLN
jgi:hypothetical protein